MHAQAHNSITVTAPIVIPATAPSEMLLIVARRRCLRAEDDTRTLRTARSVFGQFPRVFMQHQQQHDWVEEWGGG